MLFIDYLLCVSNIELHNISLCLAPILRMRVKYVTEGGRKLGEKVTKCGIHNYLLSQQEQEMREIEIRRNVVSMSRLLESDQKGFFFHIGSFML